MKKHKLSEQELQTEEWVKRATDDELTARSILKHRDAPPMPVCFFSQQLAEKYLKAFLVHQSRWYPKIHPLDVLLEHCRDLDAEFAKLKEDCLFLTSFYRDTRYPADTPDYDWNECEAAFAAAIRVKEFVQEKLKILTYSAEADRGFGALGFLVVTGGALALFAALMIARPWSATPQQTYPISDETIGAPTGPTDATDSYDRLCELTGGTAVSCPENPPPNAGMCLQCMCPEGTSWQPARGGCMHDAESSPLNSNVQPPDANTLSSIDTSDWKTYRNEEYGFEFQYPSTWSIRTDGINDLSLLRPGMKLPSKENLPSHDGVYWGDILIDIFSNPDNLSIEEYLSKPGNTWKPFDQNLPFDQIAIKNGGEIFIFRNIPGFFISSFAYIKGKRPIIEIADIDIEDEFREEIFNHILSTFKFIKSS
ncbi:MAG: HEPN domain-containing protein [bacterium]|nr:HEPN domain-containing protein [bacterium]MDZ4284484.1 HEPN domain-containing protein [Patescibacteria group bacterium]